MGPPRNPQFPGLRGQMCLSTENRTACEHLDFLPLLAHCFCSYSRLAGANMDVLTAAIPLLLKALWLSSRWAGILRVHALKRVARDNDPESEILFLRDRIAQLEVELELARGQRRKRGSKPRYTVRERLLVLWYMEYFQVPRRQVTKRLGIARSTLYRRLKGVEGKVSDVGEPVNKTPNEIAAKAKITWTGCVIRSKNGTTTGDHTRPFMARVLMTSSRARSQSIFHEMPRKYLPR